MFAASKSGRVAAAATDQYFPYVSLLPETTSTNGQQNNTFLDSSTNNFTITRNGTPTQGSVTPYWPNGYWGNYFNGSSDFLTVPSNAIFSFGTNDFTLECWVYTANPANTNGKTIVDSRPDSTNGAYWVWEINNAGRLRFLRPGGSLDVIATNPIPFNQWVHVSVTKASGTVTLWVNGASAASLAGTSDNWSSGILKIGANAYRSIVTDTYWNGYISNLRIVNGVAVYTGAFTPPTSPIAATQSSGTNISAITGTQTSLLTCQSNRFTDNSAQATPSTITVTGTPRTQAFQPFSPTASYTTAAYGGSGYFNGSSDWLSVPDNTAFALGSGDFTAECWIYPTSFANEAQIMGQWSGDVGGTTLNFALLLSSGSTGYVRLITSSNGSSVLFDLSTSTTSFTLTLNSWQHIAAVRSGSTFTLYVNGVSRATTTNASALFDATNAFTIGAESNTQAQYFTGYISNARLVKGTAVYTGAFTPPTLAPLTTAGSTSAASYASTTNVNTSFASSATSLLTNFTNAGIYDAAVQTNLITSGNAQANTAQYKWSPTSIRVDGTASTCVTFVDVVGGPADLATANGANSWTMECWIYYTASGLVFNRGGNPGVTSASYALSVSGGTGTFGVSNSTGVSAGYSITYSAGSIPTSTWVYWAATRTTAGVITTYINGVSQGSSGSGINIYNINNQQFALGATATTYGISSILTGYIQDFRITKNIVRTITTPTSAFPTK